MTLTPNPNLDPDRSPNLSPNRLSAFGTEYMHPPYISLYLPISPYISLYDSVRRGTRSARSASISPYLPISPYISLHLPISPYISLYLPISPYISHGPPSRAPARRIATAAGGLVASLGRGRR